MSLRQRITARMGRISWIRGRTSQAGAIASTLVCTEEKRRGVAAFLDGLRWEGLTVYDVGGDPEPDSVFFAQRVGAAGCVVVFEPSRRYCERIESHVAAKGCRNVRVVPVGLGERRETVEFAVPSWDVSRATSIESFTTRARSEVGVEVSRVEINSLDDEILSTGLPVPHFIMMDIEGMEYPALRGMQETMRAHRPRFLIERHGSVSLEERTGDERGIVALLESQGYRLTRIDAGARAPLESFRRGGQGYYYCEPVPSRVIYQKEAWM
jgi:FkbM family methyltransferase